MFDNCVIKTIPSDSEFREEQDGDKQFFTGQMMVGLQAIFHLDMAKDTESKILTLLKKVTFLQAGPSEQEFHGE